MFRRPRIVSVVYRPEFYSLYPGQVIRVVEIGNVIGCWDRFVVALEPQCDRTGEGEGEHVEH